MCESKAQNFKAFGCKHSESVKSMVFAQRVGGVLVNVAPGIMVEVSTSCPVSKESHHGYIPAIYCEEYCKEYEKKEPESDADSPEQ